MALHEFNLPEEEYDVLETIRRIAQRVGESLDLLTSLDAGLDEILTAFKIESGGIFVKDEKGETLKVAVHHNFTEAFIREKSTARPYEGCAGTVMVTGELFAEFKKEKRRYICEDAERLMGLDCLAASPLKSKGQTVGVLELFAPFSRRLSEKEISLLSVIGTILGTAIDNALSHQKILEESSFRRDILDAFSKILLIEETQTKLNAICESANRIFKTQGAYIFLVDEKKEFLIPKAAHGEKSDLFMQLYTSMSDPRSISSMAIRIGKAVYENNVQEKPKRYLVLPRQLNSKSILAVPLKIDGKSGSLILSDTLNDERFNEDILQKVSLFADQASIIMKDSFLMEELNRAKTRTDVLLEDSRLLLQASETITSSFDINEILTKLVELVSDITGLSRVLLFTLEGDTNFVKVAASTGEPLPLKVLTLDDIGIFARTYTNAESFWTKDFSGYSQQLLNYLEELNIKSVLSVPIKVRNRIYGALNVDEPGHIYDFTDEEIATIEGIARHAAIAIENSGAYGEQKSIAETLQKAFIPKEVPLIEGFQFGAIYRSATTMTGHVGGDFYDFFHMADNKLGILMGDVSGKGVSATAITALAKNAIKVISQDLNTPAEILTKANEFIFDNLNAPQFITAIFAVLDINKSVIAFANAGHMPPAYFKNFGFESAEFLENAVLPLGVKKQYQYFENTIAMDKNDILFLYTDGVTDARSGQTFYGQSRLMNNLVRNCRLGAKSLTEIIMQDIEVFTNGTLSDDIAMIAVGKV